MNTLNRIAKPCGIVGGVGTMLLSLLVFSLTPAYTAVTSISRDETGQILSSVTEKSFTSGNLPLLIFSGVTAVMGILALVSVLALKNKPGLRNVLMWVSIAGVIVCGLFSLGLLLLPAAILLILAAIGMKGTGATPSQKAV